MICVLLLRELNQSGQPSYFAMRSRSAQIILERREYTFSRNSFLQNERTFYIYSNVKMCFTVRVIWVLMDTGIMAFLKSCRSCVNKINTHKYGITKHKAN